MAESISLNNINIFQSEAQYLENQANLSSSDINLIPQEDAAEYSVGDATTAGLTKLYTSTGSATDGTMTQGAIKTALDSKSDIAHTHDYAGSSSAGGAATNVNISSSNADVTRYIPFVAGSGGQGMMYYTNLTFNPSTGALSASQVTSAVYNDYAEFFPRGEKTEPGDIIALDTSAKTERYIKAIGNCIVEGVHSDEFAHIIGGEEAPEGVDFVEYNLPKFIPVSLAGRVHVKVIGKVNVGDYIVPSDIAGVGKANNNPENNRLIVGHAVEASDNEEIKKIRIRVKGI